MKGSELNEEETALLDSLESGEWDSVDDLEEAISSHQKIASNTLKKRRESI